MCSYLNIYYEKLKHMYIKIFGKKKRCQSSEGIKHSLKHFIIWLVFVADIIKCAL